MPAVRVHDEERRWLYGVAGEIVRHCGGRFSLARALRAIRKMVEQMEDIEWRDEQAEDSDNLDNA